MIHGPHNIKVHDELDTCFSVLLSEPRYYLIMIIFKLFSRDLHSFIFKLSKKNRKDRPLLTRHHHRTAADNSNRTVATQPNNNQLPFRACITKHSGFRAWRLRVSHSSSRQQHLHLISSKMLAERNQLRPCHLSLSPSMLGSHVCSMVGETPSLQNCNLLCLILTANFGTHTTHTHTHTHFIYVCVYIYTHTNHKRP